MHKDELKNRVLEEARYIIDTHATVRTTAKKFEISKSTVHKDIVERLWNYSFTLAEQANKVLSENKADRASRGGQATRKKYLNMKKAG